MKKKQKEATDLSLESWTNEVYELMRLKSEGRQASLSIYFSGDNFHKVRRSVHVSVVQTSPLRRFVEILVGINFLQTELLLLQPTMDHEENKTNKVSLNIDPKGLITTGHVSLMILILSAVEKKQTYYASSELNPLVKT